MIERGRLAFIFLSLGVVLLVFGGSLLASTVAGGEDDGTDSLYKYLSVFSEVLGLVQRAYVDPTETEQLLAGAFEGAADALDPFSLYVPAELGESWARTRQVGPSHSGLVLLKERGVVYVVSVIPGSPGERAGIEGGDVISEIDGDRTRTLAMSRILDRLAAAPGTEVDLEVLHFAEKRSVALRLEAFAPPGVVLETRRGVAVLSLGGFHADTHANVLTSLEKLEEGLPGLEHLDRLVVDLRGVAGGSEEVAYRVAALFSTGEIGALKSRDGVEQRFAGSLDPRWSGELVVLVDRGTQGPAEILASVLRQSAGARLVGDHTFGYSGRQTLVPLSNGARLQITDAFYTGPDLEILDESLSPDLRVRRTFGPEQEGEASDPVLDRGLAVVLGEETIEAPAAAAA